MRIAVGADHRGLESKSWLIPILKSLQHEPIDLGTHTPESCDYPDYAAAVARLVASGAAERGILVCGTGIGMAIAANKIPGVRAGVCWSEPVAELSRRHNDLNVLCLPAEMAPQTKEAIVRRWLATEFEGGRHARRVEKIRALEG
jgi:ribose 5-phosphate isomerase B